MNFLMKLLTGPTAKPEGKTYHFCLRGGHVLTVSHVVELSLTRDNLTGQYSGYTIKWAEGHKPDFFSVSIPDIVAVTSED